MSKLHQALAALGPVESTHATFAVAALKELFSDAELICNSVPITPHDKNDTPFSIDGSRFTAKEVATNPKDTVISGMAVPALDSSTDQDLSAFQKAWNKPLKLSAKENPLGVHVYKMAGADRHGSWFARKSVHVNIGFDRFKAAMASEFAESLKVTGGPGAGAVRGIAGDELLERRVVEGVGAVEIWQLSSAFPGPVTPREFVSCIVMSDHALSAASAYEGAGGKPPRHLMIISRPTTHHNAPDRSGLVKGTYESVELIREVTVKDGDPGEDALSPVEWIMVTRSDPGGGIPRFMVERGTPGSIVADVPKFIKWACQRSADAPAHGLDDPELNTNTDLSDDQASPNPAASNPAAEASAHPDREHATNSEAAAEKNTIGLPPSGVPHEERSSSALTGILSSITSVVGASVYDYIPYFQKMGVISPMEEVDTDSSDELTDSSSISSLEGATHYNTATENPVSMPHSHNPLNSGLASASAPALPSVGDKPIHHHHHHHDHSHLHPHAHAASDQLPASPGPDDSRSSESSGMLNAHLTPCTPATKTYDEKLERIAQKRQEIDVRLIQAQHLASKRERELVAANDEADAAAASEAASRASPPPDAASNSLSPPVPRAVSPVSTSSAPAHAPLTNEQQRARKAHARATRDLAKEESRHSKQASKLAAQQQKVLAQRTKAAQKAASKAEAKAKKTGDGKASSAANSATASAATSAVSIEANTLISNKSAVTATTASTVASGGTGTSTPIPSIPSQSNIGSEIDVLRGERDALKSDVNMLLQRVRDLQAENTALVAKFGKPAETFLAGRRSGTGDVSKADEKNEAAQEKSI